VSLPRSPISEKLTCTKICRYLLASMNALAPGARIHPTKLPPPLTACSAFASRFWDSRALTLFKNAFSKTLLPMVPGTKPSSHPLRFLPSRTTSTSNVSAAVGPTRKGIGVAGGALPHIGVCRREDDVFRIGPVVVESLPTIEIKLIRSVQPDL